MIPGIQRKKTARFTNMWKTVDSILWILSCGYYPVDTILWITTPKTVDNWV